MKFGIRDILLHVYEGPNISLGFSRVREFLGLWDLALAFAFQGFSFGLSPKGLPALDFKPHRVYSEPQKVGTWI